MIKFLYSLKDELVGFGDPVSELSEEVAIRSFTEAVNELPAFRKYPKDYSLYCLGSYDTESGIIMTNPLPVKVIDAVSVLKEVKND